MLRFDPSWLRFAPLTGSGLVIAAAGIGVAGQLLQTVGFWDGLDPERWGRQLPDCHRWCSSCSALVVPRWCWCSLLSVVGYVVTNWGLRLTRTRTATGAAWHLTRGLLTTRETTLDDERVAGVSLGGADRAAAGRGARLSAIVTGLDRSQQGSSVLVPPAPRASSAASPPRCSAPPGRWTGQLARHGPAATRRRWVRALVPAARGLSRRVPRWSPSRWAPSECWPCWLLVLPVAVAARRPTGRARSAMRWSPATWSRGRAASPVAASALEVEHVIGWNFSAHLVPAPRRAAPRWSPRPPEAARRCPSSTSRRNARSACSRRRSRTWSGQFQRATGAPASTYDLPVLTCASCGAENPAGQPLLWRLRCRARSAVPVVRHSRPPRASGSAARAGRPATRRPPPPRSSPGPAAGDDDPGRPAHGTAGVLGAVRRPGRVHPAVGVAGPRGGPRAAVALLRRSPGRSSAATAGSWRSSSAMP